MTLDRVVGFVVTWLTVLLAVHVGEGIGFRRGYAKGSAEGWRRATLEFEDEIDHAYILRGEATSIVAAIAELQSLEVRRKAVKEWSDDVVQRAMRRRKP